jgi:hypothetical protein
MKNQGRSGQVQSSPFKRHGWFLRSKVQETRNVSLLYCLGLFPPKKVHILEEEKFVELFFETSAHSATHFIPCYYP